MRTVAPLLRPITIENNNRMIGKNADAAAIALTPRNWPRKIPSIVPDAACNTLVSIIGRRMARNVRHRGRAALGAILCWVMSSVRHKPALPERHFTPVLIGWIIVYFLEAPSRPESGAYCLPYASFIAYCRTSVGHSLTRSTKAVSLPANKALIASSKPGILPAIANAKW